MSLGTNFMITLCFFFYALSGSTLNSGIIVTLWNTNVMFTCIIFFVVFRQKILLGELIGMVFMVVGCVLVSIS
jgi:uncharacterized membrane protein